MMAVKYHIRTDYPSMKLDWIILKAVTAGSRKSKANATNLCYLYHRNRADEKQKTIADYEALALHKNPVLKAIFTQSDFLFDAPVVINQISFAPKPFD